MLKLGGRSPASKVFEAPSEMSSDTFEFKKMTPSRLRVSVPEFPRYDVNATRLA